MVEVKNTNANGAASFTCVTADRWWRNEFEFFLGVWQFYPNVGILRQREGNIWSECHKLSPSIQLLKVTSASFGCEWRLDAKSKNPSWLKMTSEIWCCSAMLFFASDISQIWTDLILLSVKYHILHIPDVSTRNLSCEVSRWGHIRRGLLISYVSMHIIHVCKKCLMMVFNNMPSP